MAWTQADSDRQRVVMDIVREEKARQREERARQQAAERRASKKAARRAKYKQTPEDSFLVFAWKELMR